MSAEPPLAAGDHAPGSSRGHVRSHAKGLLAVAIGSVVGALAALAFQLITARALGPADFGLLSAFLVVINVAAIGSSSLQNSVAVATASPVTADNARSSRWPVEASIVGFAAGGLVVALSPLLAPLLATSLSAVVLAAVAVPLSFLLADSVGLIQGSGNSTGAVWWSTVATLVRLVVVFVAITLGASIGGILVGVIVGMVVAAAAAAFSARRIPRPRRSVMTADGATVIVLTVAFAWLTSADVFFLRFLAPEELTGHYAAVSTLVKSSFLIPSTLALYLLPRLVRSRGDRRLARLAAIFTLVVSAGTGLLVVGLFAGAGTWLLTILYGGKYDEAAALMVPIAFAYVPWIAAFGLLVRMTALASRVCAVFLVLAVAVQALGMTALLPDVTRMLQFSFGLGVVVLAVFVSIDVFASRRGSAERIN